MTRRAPRQVLEIGRGACVSGDGGNGGAELRRASEAMAAQRRDPWDFQASRWVEAARRVLAAGPEPAEHEFDRPHEGRGWYARELINLDTLTRQHIAKNRAALAAVAGGQFAALVTEAELKFMAEPAWRIGRKVMDGGDKGAECKWGSRANRDTEAREIRRRVEEEEKALRRIGHDRPRMAALEIVAGENGCSVRTVSRRIGAMAQSDC